MANVTFRRGVEANLPTSGMAVDGCVYQSTDTGNMYVGSSQGTLIPVNRSPYYGTCTTQASTNAKVVTLDVDNDNFTMKAGVMISVLFSNANTAASPTLNVNNKGAVAIMEYGTTNVSASPRAWEAGEVVSFVHNGTYWMTVGRKIQSDWNQTNSAAYDFIKNKPTNVSAFTNDAGYITTNDIPEGAAASTTTPKMDGAAEIGTESAFARGDHRHPSDTNKQNKLIAGRDIDIQDIVEVEYLESTGTQYIDTGIAPDADTMFEIDLKINTVTKRRYILGHYSADAQFYLYISSTGYFQFSWSNVYANSSVPVSTTRHQIKMYSDGQKSYLYIDGVVASEKETITQIDTVSSTIFRGKESSMMVGVPQSVYWCIMSKNGVKVVDLIPVRVGNVGYMYDRVSGQLFGNAGTGEFILGPDVRAFSVINFINDDGFITDANVVHKTGDETVGGTKTFSNNVVLGTNANLHLLTAQGDGVYVEASDGDGVNKTLMFAGVSDDSEVKLENVATPTFGTDAANKNYVDKESGSVTFNGYSNQYGIQPKSLCAFSASAGGATMYMTSFTTGGGTGNKVPASNLAFPIGCKIYYYDESEAFASMTAFTNKKFYSSFNGVDGRYSAITGYHLSLSSSSTSNVYMRVMVGSTLGYWSPFYKAGTTTEIFVTSDDLVAGEFYIHLGKTIGTNGVMFQLEDNNPLYYYDATNGLTDWATYVAKTYGGSSYIAGQGINISGNTISAETPEVTITDTGNVTATIEPNTVYSFSDPLTSLSVTLDDSPSGLRLYHFFVRNSDFNSPFTMTINCSNYVFEPSHLLSSVSFTLNPRMSYEFSILLRGFTAYVKKSSFGLP